MALTNWHDTGREMEYCLSGTLEIYPEATAGGSGGGAYLTAAAQQISLGIAWNNGDYQVQSKAGLESRSIPLPDWTTSWTASYTVTIRMKEQVRFGRKPILDGNGNDITEQSWPEWTGEWRQVYKSRPDDASMGYHRLQINVAGHPELDIDTWLGNTLAGDAETGEFPLASLQVSSNLAAANTSPVLMARAGSSVNGFLTGDYTSQLGPHLPKFKSDSLEMYAGTGNMQDDEYSAVCGPEWRLEIDLSVQKWDQPYPGAVVQTSFMDGYLDWLNMEEHGTPVSFTTDSNGCAVGVVSGRYREIIGLPFVHQIEDSTPLRRSNRIRFTLDSEWMESAGESHYEEREDVQGRRYVVKSCDDDFMINDPVKEPFIFTNLAKTKELVLNPGESVLNWYSDNGTPSIQLYLDGEDKTRGAFSIKAVVSSEPQSARSVSVSSFPTGTGHFRYLSFDVKSDVSNALLTLWVTGRMRSLNLAAVDEENWLVGDLWNYEEIGCLWECRLANTQQGAVKVISLEDNWFRVLVDLAASENTGWGQLLWLIETIRFADLTPGIWHFDNVRLIVDDSQGHHPQCWWASDKLMRQLGASLPAGTGLWEFMELETELREREGVPTPYVIAHLYSNECLIAETNGCRSLKAGSVWKRIPTDPMEKTTYQIRSMLQACNEMATQGSGGWTWSSPTLNAPYDGSMWSRLLTCEFQNEDTPAIPITCHPKYHEMILYPRSDWHLGGMKVLQAAIDGLVFDTVTGKPLTGAQVRFLRNGQVTAETSADSTGWFLAKPVPHSDLVTNLPLNEPDGELISVDTRHDIKLIFDGRTLWDLKQDMLAVNRALLRQTLGVKAPAVPERFCLEIGRLGWSYIGWPVENTVYLRRSQGIGVPVDSPVCTGNSPWLTLGERDPSLSLRCCYSQNGFIFQKISPDGGLTWENEMIVADGSSPFFKQDPVTGITCYAFWKDDGIYFKRSSDGGVSFLESEYRILDNVPEQAVCFDFTKDHHAGIRLLYRDSGGILRTILSLDGGITWINDD